MAQTLPDGLIQSNRPFEPDSRDLQPVLLEDLISLWKTYSSVRHAVGSPTSARLEHFFWRIIGNRRLQQSLPGARIAYLHAIISQDVPIRTTPRASPLPDSKGKIRDNVPEQSALTASTDDSTQEDRGHRLTTPVQTGRERSTSRPRPILRMPGLDAINPGKSARILTPTWGQDAKIKHPHKGEENKSKRSALKTRLRTLQDPTEDPEVVSQDVDVTSQGSRVSPTVLSTSNSSRSGKKGLSIPVSSKKKKPSMPRRTSSQTTTNNKSPKPTLSPLTKITDSESPPGPKSYQQDSGRDAEEFEQTEVVPAASRSFPMSARSHSTSQLRDQTRRNIAPTLLFGAQKSALVSGVTLNSPMTASLQPFGNEESMTSVIAPSPLSQADASSLRAGSDTLPRSRSQLTLVLQKDKRRADADANHRRG